MKNTHGFSLSELMISVVIVGVLMALSLPLFVKAKERMLDKEAIANLKLIQFAERNYHIDTNSFINSTDSTCVNMTDLECINYKLKLSIPAGSEMNWNYIITGGDNFFDATANRQNPPSGWARFWSINATLEDAVCSGIGCP